MATQITDREAAGATMRPDMASEIIKALPANSVVMANAKTVRLTSKEREQPVLAALPDAFWIDGDTGNMQTTAGKWEKTKMVAEDLGVIVPIPNNVLDDAAFPLFEEMTPLIAEAIGRKIDAAALFGVDAPKTFGTPLVTGAVAAGQVVAEGTREDLGADVAELGELLASKGTDFTGFVAPKGFQWRLRGMRSNTGAPIYSDPQVGMYETQPASLYGYSLAASTNGVWDDSAASLLAVDWSSVAVGIRQDISYEVFREGVITDDSGKIIYNMMTQRMRALRVIMRVGYQLAEPLSRYGKVFPAGILTAKGDTPTPAPSDDPKPARRRAAK